MFIAAVKKLLPERALAFARAARVEMVCLREFLIDGWRYQRSSAPVVRSDTISHEHIEARLTMAYHQIEKGLALPHPRRPFGLGVRETLQTIMRDVPDECADRTYYRCSEDALRALALWNDTGRVDPVVCPVSTQPSGTLVGDRALEEFFSTRRSVRDFDETQVPSCEVMIEAVGLARHTPSVCNLQAARLHLYWSRTQIASMLALQNGNAGFGQTIPLLGVVTIKRNLFLGPAERNQRWIDGGLFAMTLVWALHGLGLSTCMLNWSMNNRASDALRQVGGIGLDEDIVVLLAVGYGRAGHRITRSERRTVDEIVTIHGRSASASDGS